MRRFVTLTLILTTMGAVAGSCLWEDLKREKERNRVPIPAAVKSPVGPTYRGLIWQADMRNKRLEIEENGRRQTIFWDERTLITVAKHRVKASALAPGATVIVDAQQRQNRLQASLIAVSPPNPRAFSR